MDYWFSFAIILAAFTIFGITGFGSAIIAVPWLVLIYPLEIVTPAVLILEFIASLLMNFHNKFLAEKKELIKIFPSTLFGMVFAVWILTIVSSAYLIVILGIFVLWNGFLVLVDAKNQLGKKVNKFWRNIFGFGAGVFATLFTTGGVFIASYLVRKIDDPKELRSTMALAILLITSSVIAIMLISGIEIAPKAINLSISLVLPMLLGASLGFYIFKGMNALLIRKFYGAILMVSGMSLLTKQFIQLINL